MTVETPYAPHDYSPGASMAPEGVPWPFLTAAHLRITHIADADGAETVLTIGDDYTVGGSGPAGTGTVTATAEWPDDDVFRVERVTPAEQKATILSGQPLPADDVNKQLDRMALIAQERDAALARALLVPIGSTPLVVGDVAEGEVMGRVDGKFVGVPNGAAEFAVEVATAKAEFDEKVETANEIIDEKVEQVEEAAETVGIQAGQVADNTGIASGAAVAAQNSALAAASALAIAQALVAAGNFYIAPMIADAIAEAEADPGLADGATFGASGEDVAYWELRERDGSSSNLFWPFPKAIMPGAALRKITHDRALTLADAAVAPDPPPIQIMAPRPAGMWLTITVPSNSVTPIPAGTMFPLITRDGNPVRLVSDGVDDDVNIEPLNSTLTALVGQGKRAWLMKADTGPNDWLWWGELSLPPEGAYSVKVFLDGSAAHTRKQEITGAAATTPAGDGQVVGSWRNLGTHGGYAMARTDVRRPLVDEHADGRVEIVTDGNATAANADFLELTGIPVNYAKLNLFVAFKARGYQFGDGIISLAPDGASGDNGNDRFAISHITLNNSLPTDFAFNMGVTPNRLSVGVQGMNPLNPHVVEWRKTANNVPATINIDGMEITHTGATGLPALANVTALVEAVSTLRIGANPGDNGGQNGAIQHSNTGYYFVVLHDEEPLTLAQRQAIRMYGEVLAHDPNPEYPAWADVTAMEADRDVLIDEVFPGEGLPTDIATKTVDVARPVTSMNHLVSQVYKLTIPGEADTNIKPRLYVPLFIRPGVTAQIIAGHAAGWNANGIPILLQRYLEQGVPVVLHCLPDGPNDFTSGSPTNHSVNQTAYAKFARQVVVARNMLLEDYPGSDGHICGISGGGWTTMLCAALDKRFTVSVHFVGSAYRKHYLNVDYEQHGTQISFDELALYVLGASPARIQRDIKRKTDDAGFDLALMLSRTPYADGVRVRAAELGDGDYLMIMEDGSAHAMTNANADMMQALLP